MQAIAKTMSESELSYLHEQFTLLGPNKNGDITLRNFKQSFLKTATDASTKDSRVLDFVHMVIFSH